MFDSQYANAGYCESTEMELRAECAKRKAFRESSITTKGETHNDYETQNKSNNFIDLASQFMANSGAPAHGHVYDGVRIEILLT